LQIAQAYAHANLWYTAAAEQQILIHALLTVL